MGFSLSKHSLSQVSLWMESPTHVKDPTQCLVELPPAWVDHSDLLMTVPVLALKAPCPCSPRGIEMGGPPDCAIFQAQALFSISSHWPPANLISMTWQRWYNYVEKECGGFLWPQLHWLDITWFFPNPGFMMSLARGPGGGLSQFFILNSFMFHF